MENTLDQYFELALDLPGKMRQEMLEKLDREDPGTGEQLRAMLDRWVTNSDFACEVGVGGQPKQAKEPKQSDERDRLHHIAIQVTNIGEAVLWYRQHFGCDIEYADASWALLSFENLRVALVLPEQHPSHFALERVDAERFGDVREHRDGTRYVYTQDPWGNTIEILQTGSKSA